MSGPTSFRVKRRLKRIRRQLPLIIGVAVCWAFLAFIVWANIWVDLHTK